MKNSEESKEGFITSHGFKMHYLEWGEKGASIVALHSMMADAHSFDLFSRAMAQDCRVLAIDLLGHGDSDKSTSKISIEEQTEIVREVVQKREFTNIILVGHSIGGFLSVVYAARHPEEVSKLILVDIAPRDPAERKGGRGTYDTPIFNSRSEVEEYFEEQFSTFTPEALENRLRFGVEEMPKGKFRLKTSMATLAMITETIALADIRPYVKMVKAPTLLVKGGESANVSKRSVELLKTTLKDFTLVEVAEATHMVPQDQPKEFEETIRKFIQQ